MHLKSDLDHKGAMEYVLKDKIFDILDIRNLEKDLFQQENFEPVEKGDTDESSSLLCLRIKKPDINLYTSKKVENLLGKNEFISFLKSQTNLKRIEIDRCQAHVYKTGDFLSLHNDTESCAEYKYSCILFLSDDYEGGEFKVYNRGNCYSFKPNYGSLLIIKSGLMHEVCKIKKGIRKVLVFFLKSNL
tara:strand:- start:160 stop:723 length:564 start_codon:yes stop_codon:yes gene_type:complete